MEPMRERMFFAGEAVHETLWGTVGGAWESGERAADAALRLFGIGVEAAGNPAEAPATAAAMKPKALIAWSSGKDCAWALHEVRRAGDYEMVGALTTVTETFGARQHAWRARGLLLRAARGDRLPLDRSCAFRFLVRTTSMKREWRRRWRTPNGEGVTHVIFGDLFLEDVRAYREQQLARCGHHAGCFRYGSARPLRWRTR